MPHQNISTFTHNPKATPDNTHLTTFHRDPFPSQINHLETKILGFGFRQVSHWCSSAGSQEALGLTKLREEHWMSPDLRW